MRILGAWSSLLLSVGVLLAQVPKDLPRSPLIRSISLATPPLMPFPSMGDLWFTTWAEDDHLYGSWGDGRGPADERSGPFVTGRQIEESHESYLNRFDGPTARWSWSLMTDCGLVQFTGNPPNLKPRVVRRDAPTQFEPRVDDKPSSFLSIDGRLYGQFHSPLGDARIGYLAYSDDQGSNWSRIGFFLPGATKPANASPWTKEANSNFRCLLFINMGKNYSLNSDGYIYGLGIGKEWNWDNAVYLARVAKADILRYQAWEYFAGLDTTGKPRWSSAESDAKPVPDLYTPGQGSAIYHPGIKRYLFMNEQKLWDAPEPWGPWTVAGDFPSAPPEWQHGYQPGIITKGLGPDSFWFTIAGQGAPPSLAYSFHIGQMVMHLAPGLP